MQKNKRQGKLTGYQKIWSVIALCIFAAPAWADGYYNLTQGLHYILVITQDVAIALGLGIFISGLFRLKRYGESRTFMSQQVTIARPLFSLLAGTFLLCLPVFTKTAMLAFWGTTSPLAYPIMSSFTAQQAIKPIIEFIRLVGVFGLIRGIVLLSRCGGEQAQPGTIGKAIMHMLGGLLCIHIMGTYSIIKWLFSFS